MCKHEEKKCPRCNVSFECKPGNIGQCQCYGIALSSEEKVFIAETYSDCLCAQCLHALSHTNVRECLDTNQRELGRIDANDQLNSR